MGSPKVYVSHYGTVISYSEYKKEWRDNFEEGSSCKNQSEKAG